MRKIQLILLLFANLICLNTFAQAYSILWENTFGGSSYDRPFAMKQTLDGGSILVGTSSSNDGDVIGNSNIKTCWIVKLSPIGAIEWQKSYGGSSLEDCAMDVLQLSDGGFIIAAQTFSNDGDISFNNGGFDYWLLKLTANGDLIWEKTFGGSENDWLSSIVETSDGGFVLAGTSNSSNGNITNAKGLRDIWIVKLTSNGNLVWQKSFGGSNDDLCNEIKLTSDGGFIICGQTLSNNFDVSGHHGGSDFWVIKLNFSGNLVWQKCIGGSNEDYATDIIQTSDGGYMVTGYSSSLNGDFSGVPFMSSKLVKLNSTGVIEWQKNFSGVGYSVVKQTNDGGYVLADGDHNYVIYKLDIFGNTEWEGSYGGPGSEYPCSIYQASDGTYLVAGQRQLSTGVDFWVIKLGVNLTIKENDSNSIVMFPVPFYDFIILDNLVFPDSTFKYKIYNINSKLVKAGVSETNKQISLENFNKGYYIMEIETENGEKLVKKLIKN